MGHLKTKTKRKVYLQFEYFIFSDKIVGWVVGTAHEIHFEGFDTYGMTSSAYCLVN